MLFFALKKNSINDAMIKSPKSVSSQRSLTVFLEAEKNMFDHLKAFITLSFFLNTGCLAALFQFRPDIKCCIILLSIGTEISLILYLISFFYFLTYLCQIYLNIILINLKHQGEFLTCSHILELLHLSYRLGLLFCYS